MLSKNELLEGRRNNAKKNLSNVKVYLFQCYDEIEAYYCAKDVDLTSEEVDGPLMDLYDDGPFVNTQKRSNIIKVNEAQFIDDLNLVLDKTFSIKKSVAMGQYRPMIAFSSLSPEAIKERKEPMHPYYDDGITKLYRRPSAAEKQAKFQSRFASLPLLLEQLGMEVIIDERLKSYLDEYVDRSSQELEMDDENQSPSLCSSFLIDILTSNTTKYIASILIVAGIIGVTVGSLGIGGVIGGLAGAAAIALTATSGTTLGVGSLLGIGGFFASSKNNHAPYNDDIQYNNSPAV